MLAMQIVLNAMGQMQIIIVLLALLVNSWIVLTYVMMLHLVQLENVNFIKKYKLFNLLK